MNGVVAIPDHLASKSVLSVTVDHDRHAVRSVSRNVEQSSSILPTVRVMQRLLHEVRLPVAAYAPSTWCKVHTLDELEQRLNAAAQLGRMLIVVCSGQNETFWVYIHTPLPYPSHTVLYPSHAPFDNYKIIPCQYYLITRFYGFLFHSPSHFFSFDLAPAHGYPSYFNDGLHRYLA